MLRMEQRFGEILPETERTIKHQETERSHSMILISAAKKKKIVTLNQM